MHIYLQKPYNFSEVSLLKQCHLDYCCGNRNAERIAATEPIQWNNLKVCDEDRSLPEEVEFEWSCTSGQDAVSFNLYISESPVFEDAVILSNLSKKKISVPNLLLGVRYYWKVISKESGRIKGESDIRSFVTSDVPPRWVKVPGITNARDIGGWKTAGGKKVKQGLVYRSSEMNSHKTIADEGKRILLDMLHIRTDLDLRGAEEETIPVLDSRSVNWINIPIAPYENITDEQYWENYRMLFSVFSDTGNYPILLHCWGGVDRGGTVVFLLNALLGVREQDLILDYELSSFSIWGPRSRESKEFKGLMAALDRFGEPCGSINAKVENYLKHIGVTEEMMCKIKYLLTA